MKLMFLNKAYTTSQIQDLSPCKLCVYSHTDCTHIPTDICVLYGGFQLSDTKIFTL